MYINYKLYKLTSVDSNVDVVAVIADGPRRAAAIDDVIVEVAAHVLVVVIVVVVVARSVSWRPLHLVLLLEPPPRVGEPRRDLRQRHLGDDRQHDLLALGRVGVLDVFVQPRLQSACRLAGGVLPPDVEGTVAARISTTDRRHHYTAIYTAVI